jgi:DNA-binding CsgD family transcriptional regulator
MTDDVLRGPWPFTGRDDELRTAMAALADGRPVVISGSGGVGKTRLLRALADEATSAGWQVRNAVGSATAVGIPLGAVAHLVPAEAMDASRDNVMRAIAMSVRESERRSGQVLLCIDDSHVVDDASAMLVAHLARHTGEGFGLALVLRSGHAAPEAIENLAIDDLVHRIRLDPLDEEETGRLLDGGLGAAVDPVTVRLLARWTRGNVLFLRELVRDGIERDALRLEDGTWRWNGPPTVGPTLRELITARHARLPDAQREALEAVAIGEPLPAPALSAMVDEASVVALDTAGLLVWVDESGRVEVRLSHPLHGEALRSSLAQSSANRIRRRLADVLAEVSTDPRDQLRRAVLLADAGLPADPVELVTAARRSWALRDTALVERLARAALRSGPNPEADYLLGEALADHGDYEGAVASWTDILDGELPESLRVRVAVAAASVMALTLQRPDDARELLDRTEATVATADARWRVVGSRSALFGASVVASGGSAAVEVDGLQAADEVPDQARILSWLGTARGWLLEGRAAQVLAEIDHITAVARRASDEFPMAAMFVGICRFFALVQSGRLGEATSFAETEREASLMDPLPIAPATWSQGLGIVAMERGHLAEATVQLRAAAALMRNNDLGNLRHVLHELALTRALAGDRAGVAAALAEATTANSGLIEPFVEAVRADAALLAAEGEVSEARRLLADHVAGRPTPLPFYDVPAHHDLARYGAPADAATALAGMAATVDGELVARYADQAAALAAQDADGLEAVADWFEANGYELDAAESLVAASEAARGTGRARRSTALGLRADDLLARCGPEPPRTPLLRARGEVQSLTDREREVAALTAAGFADKEVAERLAVSPRTVHAHLRAVYRKLGVTDRRELADRWNGNPSALPSPPEGPA